MPLNCFIIILHESISQLPSEIGSWDDRGRFFIKDWPRYQAFFFQNFPGSFKGEKSEFRYHFMRRIRSYGFKRFDETATTLGIYHRYFYKESFNLERLAKIQAKRRDRARIRIETRRQQLEQSFVAGFPLPALHKCLSELDELKNFLPKYDDFALVMTEDLSQSDFGEVCNEQANVFANIESNMKQSQLHKQIGD